MTYDEAIAFWYERINYEVRSATSRDLKLERMHALMHLLGDPQDRLRIIHLAGTKGKGSTAAMLAAMLQSAGYRVGLFTSPHLEHVEERIQVDRVPISHAELAARMQEIAVAVQELSRGPWPPPTFFEIGTALGFLHFAYRRVEVAVIEVGLGGRFDSTNICRPMVSVLTSIGMDHTAQLGSTIKAITFQKAGIIKPRVPVVSGVSQPEAMRVVGQIAKEQRSRLRQLGRDFHFGYRCNPQARLLFDGTEYELGLLGEHQASNAAVALETVRVLSDSGLSLSESAIRSGLKSVHWPARVEVVGEAPITILDTAHNAPSVEALVNTLRDSFPHAERKTVLIAVSSDKPYPEMLRILAGYFDAFVLTTYSSNPRTVPVEKLAGLVRECSPGKSITVESNAVKAWQLATVNTAAGDLVCVTGSVFLAGELNSLVRHRALTCPARRYDGER